MISSRAEFYNRQIWSHDYATRYKYQDIEKQQDVSLKTIQKMSDDLERLQRQRSRLQDITISKIQMSNYLNEQKKLKMKAGPLPIPKNDSRIYFDKRKLNPQTTYQDTQKLNIDQKLFLTESHTVNPLHIKNFQRPLSHRENIQQISKKQQLLVSGKLDNLFNFEKQDDSLKLQEQWLKQRAKFQNDDVVEKVLSQGSKLRNTQSSGLGLSRAQLGDDF